MIGSYGMCPQQAILVDPPWEVVEKDGGAKSLELDESQGNLTSWIYMIFLDIFYSMSKPKKKLSDNFWPSYIWILRINCIGLDDIRSD